MRAGPDFRYTRLLTNRRLLIPGNRNSEKPRKPGRHPRPELPPCLSPQEDSCVI